MSEHEDTGGRLGQVIADRFRLERVLGQGGMAAVYLAHDEKGEHGKVAIKILHSEMAARKEVRERFLREGYVANQVDHPGAVKVLEHGTAAGGTVFLVMELLQGDSFGERLKHEGKLPVDAVLEALEQLLEVMAVAHDRGIVHRDIKPDNLFWTDDGKLKVLDFGLARLHESIPTDVRTRTGIAMGTLPYMAPEQALGRRTEIDGRTDLFAIGATALKLLTNKKVHEADSEAELLMAMASKPAPPVASVAPLVPVALAQIVDRSLAFHRDARYPSARDMLEDVRAVRAGSPPPVAARLLAAETEATRPERVAPAVAAVSASTAPVAVATSTPAITASTISATQEKPKRRLGILLAAAAALLALFAAAAFALGRSSTADATDPSAQPAVSAASVEANAPNSKSASTSSARAEKTQGAARSGAPRSKSPSPPSQAPAPPPAAPPSPAANQAAVNQAVVNQAAQAAAGALDAAVKQQAAERRERRHKKHP